MSMLLASGAESRVVEQSGHFDVHERVQQAIDADGQAISVTNRVTVLQPGLNFYSEPENRWLPSSDQIDLVERGAKFSRGPFQVDFAPNYKEAVSPIVVTLANGTQVKLKTAGIAITAADGDGVWLGELKESSGALVGNNIVRYADAFTGLKADIQTRVFVGGFASDVVLREAPNIDFEALQINPVGCRLEVWHEIVELAMGNQQTGLVVRKDGATHSDLQIDFGGMLLTEGAAFLTDNATNAAAITAIDDPSEAVRVVKEIYVDPNQKRFLIESIPYAEALPALQRLPLQARAALDDEILKKILGDRATRNVAEKPARQMPVRIAAAAMPSSTGERKIAAIQRTPIEPSPGYVLDYTIVATASNVTFEGGKTYYVTNLATLSGTTKFEGNTVIKYGVTNNARLEITGPIECHTSLYAPAIFTSDVDNTIGETISPGTSLAYYGYPIRTLSANTNVYDLHDMRFNYAFTGLRLESLGAVAVANVQATACNTVIDRRNGSLNVRNLLSVGASAVISGQSSTLIGEHITAHNGGTFFSDAGSSTLSVTNSLIVGVSILGTSNTNNTAVLSSGSVFQTVGAGEHYLANDDHRNVGSSVSSTTGAILAKTTTKPPTVKTGLVGSTNLWSQGLGDTDTPDRGFHYAIVDFVADNFGVTNSGSTLTLSTNVVVATYNGMGLVTSPSCSIVSEGIPPGLNRIIRYSAVQEKPLSIGLGGAYVIRPNNSTGATIRFTEFSGYSGYHIYEADATQFETLSVRDSHFRAGVFKAKDLNSTTATFALTNNIFERCEVRVEGENTGYFYNNLFFGNTFYIDTDTLDNVLTFKDNVFDNCVITSFSDVISSHTAYLSAGTPTRLTPLNQTGEIITSVFIYETGPLGRFYHSSTTLQNAGSRNATNAGLFHYTTRTSQAKETNSVVDIGAHYISLNGLGLPNDYDGDDLPDYLEDPNGNGLLDTGETPWSHDYDYDGVPTWVEIYDGTKPEDPNDALSYRLGYWQFNSSSYLGSRGQTPLNSTTVSAVASWSGNSGSYTSTGGPVPNLSYNEIEADSWPNLNCRAGTVRLWLKPTWGAGAAPAQMRLLDIGDADEYWRLYVTNSGTVLRLECHSNNLYQWAEAPVSLQNNYWISVAVTYSPTNVAFYTNGVCARGSRAWIPMTTFDYNGNYAPYNSYGVPFWPSAGKRDDGFSIGGASPLLSNNLLLKGELDEVETFNYPLSAAQIAADFPKFTGYTGGSITTDTDYDGRSDMLETYVDGTSGGGVKNVRLAYLRFNDNNNTGEQGQVPTGSSGVWRTPGWSDTFLAISNTSPANVTYRDVESNGSANFNAKIGSVRFWFKPYWEPTAPPSEGAFLYMGRSDQAQRWELRFESSGNNIRLITAGASGTETNFTSSHQFDSTKWYQIVLTHGSGGASISKLYINGSAVVTNGLGVSFWPDTASRANGLVIGNKTGGGLPINGFFDEIETFNYELSASDIAAAYSPFAAVDSDSNGTADVLEDITLTSSESFIGTPFVVTGVVEAEQFDKGGMNKGYYKGTSNIYSDYRKSRVQINATTDLGLGYCIDDMRSNDWTQYTIDVRVGQTYCVEPRVLWAGTNAAYKIQFSTDGGNTFYKSVTNYVTANSWTNNWTNVGATNTLLTNGIQAMRITILTNGYLNAADVGYAAKINYVSIYPWWDAGVSNHMHTIIVPSSSLTNGTNWSHARTNAMVIQAAFDSTVGYGEANGATVLLPSGTYYIAQPRIQEDIDQHIEGYYHSALKLPRGNIVIAGQGKNSTKLIAFDRMTTIVNVGRFNDSAYAFENTKTNITIRDIEFEARPHSVTITNSAPPYDLTATWEAGRWAPGGSGSGDITYGGGSLIVIMGAANDHYTRNVLIQDCRFNNADRSLHFRQSVGEVLIRRNEFLGWSGDYTGQMNNPPTPHTIADAGGRPAIQCWGGGRFIQGGVTNMLLMENVVAVDNVYNGNPSVTASVSYLNEHDATDGLYYSQQGGNIFVSRNTVTNNFLEGVYVTSGPSAVVQNTYRSYIHNAATTAILGGNISMPFQTLTLDSRDSMLSFVANQVRGGGLGWISNGGAAVSVKAQFCSNDIELDPPWDLVPYEAERSMAQFKLTEFANVCGNTLRAGYRGLLVDSPGNLLILKNDLSGASQGGVFLSFEPANNHAIIAKNILHNGRGFHAFAAVPEGHRIFVLKNNFWTASSTNAAPVFDRLALPVHFNP